MDWVFHSLSKKRKRENERERLQGERRLLSKGKRKTWFRVRVKILFKLKTGFASIVSFIFDSIWTNKKNVQEHNKAFQYLLYCTLLLLLSANLIASSSSTLGYFAIMLNPSYHGYA
ncbi:hypothetical protein NC652_007684 [Populus alba x Populus x berolinensis]|nr:hypothetical protein NC652_007684 [Populus alba x Populus x berolinensis]